MSTTYKLKAFYEYKALISFKFANKYSIIRKISLKFPMHYAHSIFGGNSLIENGNYLVVESSYFCVVMKMKFS